MENKIKKVAYFLIPNVLFYLATVLGTYIGWWLMTDNGTIEVLPFIIITVIFFIPLTIIASLTGSLQKKRMLMCLGVILVFVLALGAFIWFYENYIVALVITIFVFIGAIPFLLFFKLGHSLLEKHFSKQKRMLILSLLLLIITIIVLITLAM